MNIKIINKNKSFILKTTFFIQVLRLLKYAQWWKNTKRSPEVKNQKHRTETQFFAYLLMSIFQKSWHFYEKSFQAERFIFINYLKVHILKDLNPKGYIKIMKKSQITARYLCNEVWDFFTSIFVIINELNSQCMIST